MTDVVHAVCPLCQWESPPATVREHPNAEWHARMEAGSHYWEHFSKHRPIPIFINRTSQT